jgi:hypothetical protein
MRIYEGFIEDLDYMRSQISAVVTSVVFGSRSECVENVQILFFFKL